MNTLKQYISEAEKNKVAIGHFNITTLDMGWAVFEAAQNVSEQIGQKIPVVIGFSEGERDFFGVRQSVEFVKSLREQYAYPIFINADHTYSAERCKEAIDAGYDMVIMDAAKNSYEENVAWTKEVVAYRDQVGSHALVEAELGFIGAGSNIKDEVPEEVSEATMTSPEQAKEFVDVAGVDLVAPSIGNIHGMVKTGNPRLDPDRVASVRESGGVPLVLHGGSGSADEDFTAVIKAGISMIHISTELRVAYHDALKQELGTTDNLQPYKYMKPARAAMREVVEKRMKLFWS